MLAFHSPEPVGGHQRLGPAVTMVTTRQRPPRRSSVRMKVSLLLLFTFFFSSCSRLVKAKIPPMGPIVAHKADNSLDSWGSKSTFLQQTKIQAKHHSNNHSLQSRSAEEHLCTHNTSNLEADELQQQMTTPSVSKEEETEATIHTIVTKTGQQKIAKTFPDLMSLDFCCNIQRVWSQLGINNMKAWIHPAW
ncbi:hypothetical protein CCH79_00020282 [Gambusia affinis]|uniref:Uncharacterized protein n=1 Tax=Gambusia affinis TaxID=33528 RepID=A0A315V994_GAMAF|nr:hypothetical protein CCH79_00020282 [Gambusia affinis]